MDPLSSIGEIAGLAKVIFQWVTEPEGYAEWSLDKKLRKLHEASTKALAARDYVALDALARELRRLSDEIV